jgi:dTDP-4-amino-4,6-dideoxygalactose transaminase
MTGLKERGVGSGIHFTALHLHDYYQKRFGYKPGDFPIAESIGSRTLSLPLYPQLTLDELDRVANGVCEVLRTNTIS